MVGFAYDEYHNIMCVSVDECVCTRVRECLMRAGVDG